MAMVVPVAVSSAKELAATEVDKETASFTLSTVTVMLVVAVLVPSVADRVKV